MSRIRIMFALAMYASSGCGVETEDGGDRLDDREQASFSYYPMGFARVSAAGGVVTQFNSTGGAVSVAHVAGGGYDVSFAGLGLSVGGGNVQVTAEGTGNAWCRILAWSGAPDLSVRVQCATPDFHGADSAFAVLFYRYNMPAPNPWPTTAAYTYVLSDGEVPAVSDYNSSGAHNTVTKVGTGRYTVHITNATAINASMMVTASNFGTWRVCSVAGWSAGVTSIECRNRLGSLADSEFAFSYAVTGPTRDQQGAHAWFNGTSASPTYSAALGKVSYCSPASVTGSRSGSLVTMVVSGDLGSWDGGPFRRASFVSKYGAAGYCKVESLTSSGTAPSSTGTTTVRCYSATGAVVAAPQLTFTHVTSDASGPC